MSKKLEKKCICYVNKYGDVVGVENRLDCPATEHGSTPSEIKGDWEDGFDNDLDFKALFFGEMKSLYYTRKKLKSFIKQVEQESYQRGQKDAVEEILRSREVEALGLELPFPVWNSFKEWLKQKQD